jgi:hypothetical protein
LGCAGLKVTSATFSSPNVDYHPVIEPIKTQGNLQGPYLSTQQSGLDATHTLPLAINFSPTNAKITEVNIGVSPDGNNPAFSSDNLLEQAHASSVGKITFSKISLPAFASGMDNGKLVATVRIKGTVENTETSFDPAEGGQIGFDGKTAFTPLYFAGNIARVIYMRPSFIKLALIDGNNRPHRQQRFRA